jgi:hypothetical protein
MSAGSYHDILKRVRDELSDEEQQRLVEELAKSGPSANGSNASGRSLFDALKDRGLIGFMHDGPTDLSTNPRHMEGFGRHAE